ncbi:MAG TPA: DUF4395 domain-containing protein [Mycobacteriales bacterium]|jgi:hypothetical protein|nr:DUF4395 domain-containing protein [Mycobacteriales bacterium]
MDLVDPRGLRFAAWLTTVVLAIVLITGSAWLLLVQTVVFALGAFLGLRAAPYGQLFRVTLARRLGPPAEREPAAPPRFAQGVGFGFAAVGTAAFFAGLDWLGLVATALALAAAFLNAAFGFCLGCQLYLLIRRITTPKGVTA